jgi:hypothetical protein
MGLFSFGGSGSKEKTSGKSSSTSDLNQMVFGTPQHQQMMQGLNQGYANYFNPYMNMGMGMMNQVNPYMQYGPEYAMNQLDRYNSGGYGETDVMRNQLNQNIQNMMANPSQTGRMYEDIVGGSGNTYIDPLVNSMWDSGMERLGTMQSGNAVDAASAGQSGSSRHAMTDAMSERMIHSDMTDKENALRAGAYDTDLNWKMKIAQQADTGRQNAINSGFQFMDTANTNDQWAMNYLPTTQNMGMGLYAPWMQSSMMPFNMMNMYSQAFPDPTVLSSATSDSQSSSSGSGKSGSAGFSFGSAE